MKQKTLRILLLALLIADLIFIYSNSAQNAELSSSASQNVTEIVAPVVVPDYNKMDDDSKAQAILSLEAVLRELAHMLQFTPLGFSLYLLLNTFKERRKLFKYKLPITLGFGLLYAISDEIHQIFSPGRAFQAFDLLMDMTGVTAGCIGAIVLLAIIKAVQSRRTAEASTT